MTKDDVRSFLEQFHVKMSVFDILFLDTREKNRNTLKELGITALERLEVIKALEVDDYSETIMDVINDFGEMWIFGKDVNDNEVYIKLSIGKPNCRTICVSFHKAEHPMSYPFK